MKPGEGTNIERLHIQAQTSAVRWPVLKARVSEGPRERCRDGRSLGEHLIKFSDFRMAKLTFREDKGLAVANFS